MQLIELDYVIELNQSKAINFNEIILVKISRSDHRLMGTFCTFLILSIHKGQYQAIDLDQTRMDKRDDLYRAKGIVLPAEQGGKCRSVDFAISLICGISNIRLTLTRHIFIDLE